MCMERRRFSQTVASEWQTAFVVSHKMPCCALLTAVKNLESLEKLQDFFFKTKTKCSRPRLHDPRPRLSLLSSRRLETKTLVSMTTSLHIAHRLTSMFWVSNTAWYYLLFTLMPSCTKSPQCNRTVEQLPLVALQPPSSSRSFTDWSQFCNAFWVTKQL